MTASADRIAILRIELEDIEPLIWQRVAVRMSMNLKALHSVIQATMGWLDCHLWEFTPNGRKYGMFIPDDPRAISKSCRAQIRAGTKQSRFGSTVPL